MKVVLLNGNTFINGNMQSALKLLEGIREFDITLLSSTTLTIDGRAGTKGIFDIISPGGKMGVKIESSSSMSMIENLLMVGGFYPIQCEVDEHGQVWSFYQKKLSERGREFAQCGSLLDYIRKATSILCIEEEIINTTKNILMENNKDKNNRTFVALYDGSDSTIYEKVKKHCFIYETPLVQIILEPSDMIAA
jgi:hypothetical protein